MTFGKIFLTITIYSLSYSAFALGQFNGSPGRDGQDGENGTDGRSSISQYSSADNGSNGKNASQSTPGSNGKDISLKISIINNKIVLSGSYTGTYDLTKKIIIDTRGGNGGNGGNGGDGGKGGDGKDGVNADTYSDPTNGSDGGNGGNGGIATDGSNGGDAGNITVEVNPEDAYILQRFEFHHSGGIGGRAGTSGSAGSGGEGGKKGDSSYYDFSDSEHKSKGYSLLGREGSQGRAGEPGRSGRNGKDGKLLIISNNVKYTSGPKLQIVKIEMEEAANDIDKDGVKTPNEIMSVKSVTLKNSGSMPLKLSGDNAAVFSSSMTNSIKLAENLELKANESVRIVLPKDTNFKLPDAQVDKAPVNVEWAALITSGDLEIAKSSGIIQMKSTGTLSIENDVMLTEKDSSGKVTIKVSNESYKDRTDFYVRVKKKNGKLGAFLISEDSQTNINTHEPFCDKSVPLGPMQTSALEMIFNVNKAAEILTRDDFEVELVQKLSDGTEKIISTNQFSVNYALSNEFTMNLDNDVKKLKAVCVYEDGDKHKINRLIVRKKPGSNTFQFQYEKDGLLWNYMSSEISVRANNPALRPFIIKLSQGAELSKKELSEIFDRIIIPANNSSNKDWAIKDCY